MGGRGVVGCRNRCGREGELWEEGKVVGGRAVV